MILGRKILIVDGDAGITDLLMNNFTGFGYDVRSARDGEEGIKMAEDYKPDIIITEIFLQQINGIEMCRILRKKKGFQTLPFIILSDSGEEWHYLSAVFAGASSFEMKPVKFSYLMERVQKAISERKRDEDLETTVRSIPLNQNLPNFGNFAQTGSSFDL